MYMSQAICHSLVAAVITDRAMRSWNIQDPLLRQRFRVAVILLAVLSFPVYQIINPARSSPQFRMGALFDVNRWLALEIWGMFPIGLLFVFMLAATALVFLFQEMIPVITHTAESKSPDQGDAQRPVDPFLETAAKSLSLDAPRVFVIDDDEPVLFSTTGKDPAIYLSSTLERSLTPEQMQAALAHELAHITRNKRPLLMMVFILRIVMFFNPVVLVKFRKAVRDEEKICDDIAVSLTGNPGALAAALEKFYQKAADAPGPEPRKLQAFANSLEEQSHNEHLENRIMRLRQNRASGGGTGRFPFIIAVVVILVLNYLIV
jgi:Zn-dependent protease with chaperone function